MKLKFYSLQLAFTLATYLAQAQGTLFVSNLGPTSTGSMVVGSDSWIAQTFGTGTNSEGYVLNSIQLLIIGASGNPSGFNVSIYSSTGNVVPGSNLGSLGGVDPTAGGLFTYATSDIILSSSTYYFLVLTGATPVAQGAYGWSGVDYTVGAGRGPGDPWEIQDFYYSSANGSSWTFHPRELVFQLGINATAVPEPSTLALAGLGLACFGLWRRRRENDRLSALMKKVISIILLALGLLLPLIAQAQGTLYVSNLAQPSVGSMVIGSDAWTAQPFSTGTNSEGYALNSIQLLMDVASGTPSGFAVSIYSSPGNGAPGSSLGSLSPIDPSAGGLFSLTASDMMLSPSTLYYAVVTGATAVAQGAFNWSVADSFGNNTTGPGDPWIIADAYYSSANGSTWTFHVRQDVFQLGINATAVPEPSTLALAGLGLVCFGFWPHRQRK